MLIDELRARLDSPTSRGLAVAITRMIREDVLVAGTKLPPIRAVATQLGLSPTTVSAAWSVLIRTGAIRTDGRRGTVIADTAAPAVTRYKRALERQTAFPLDVATGVPDEGLLPDFRTAIEHVTMSGTPRSYLDDPVLPALRDLLLSEWPYRPPQLTIVDGAMDAFDLIVRTCFMLGDRVALEDPSYPPIIDLLDAAGVEVVGVPMDEQGISASAIGDLSHLNLTAVVVQPRAQNPTGISMTVGRAKALAAKLRGTKTLIIEDDSSGMISSSVPLSLGRWLPEQTIHIKSFSKSHGPDLRLAAMSGPADVMKAITARRLLGQGWSSRLLQVILAGLLTDPAAVVKVHAAREEYARRLRSLVDELAKQGIEVMSRDGINVWIPVHDEAATIIRLAAEGVGAAPGRPFATTPAPQPHIRVTAGLVSGGYRELAELIATAARTASWGTGVR